VVSAPVLAGIGEVGAASDVLVDQHGHQVTPGHHPVIMTGRLADHVRHRQVPPIRHQQPPDAHLDQIPDAPPQPGRLPPTPAPRCSWDDDGSGDLASVLISEGPASDPAVTASLSIISQLSILTFRVARPVQSGLQYSFGYTIVGRESLSTPG